MIFSKRKAWDKRYEALREPKIKSAVPHSPEIQRKIVEELKENGFNVVDIHAGRKEYEQFVEDAGYDRFPDYFGGIGDPSFIEKSLEHFLAAKLLGLSETDVYIDIASCGSPVPGIYNKLFGCSVYRQDIIYRKGFHGDKIGGDAALMPLPDGFATRMGLHCSFEHFENDSDIRFIIEAGRVLKQGGKLCILPLYLFETYAIQTDPGKLSKKISFEEDAVLYCVKGWNNRHGRFYDVPHLISRVKNNLDTLRMTVYVVENEKEIHRDCYLKFIALLEKE